MKVYIKILFVTLVLLSFWSFEEDKPQNNKDYTFVLVHGAWHGSWAWFKMEAALKKDGHEVFVINLPGHGLDTTNKASVTLADYRDAVLEVIDAQPDPVILVGHSMGGIVISEVAEARPEKIDKLIYIGAFMLENGQSLLNVALSDNLSLMQQYILPAPEKGVIDIERSIGAIQDVFFNRDNQGEEVYLSRSLLTANPIQPLTTPIAISDSNFGQVRRFYVKTNRDQTISPHMQEQMIDALPCEKVVKIESDHTPFLTKANTLVGILERLARTKKNKTSLTKKSDDNEAVKIKLYSTEGNIVVEQAARTWEPAEMKIYSMSGKLLKQQQINDKEYLQISTEEFSEPMVIVKIIESNGNSISKKILVNR